MMRTYFVKGEIMLPRTTTLAVRAKLTVDIGTDDVYAIETRPFVPGLVPTPKIKAEKGKATQQFTFSEESIKRSLENYAFIREREAGQYHHQASSSENDTLTTADKVLQQIRTCILALMNLYPNEDSLADFTKVLTHQEFNLKEASVVTLTYLAELGTSCSSSPDHCFSCFFKKKPTPLELESFYELLSHLNVYVDHGLPIDGFEKKFMSFGNDLNATADLKVHRR